MEIKSLDWKVGIGIILGSILLSLFISLSANTTGMGIASLLNLVLPPFVGICTIIVYVFAYGIYKNWSKFYVILCCIVNIVFGFLIYQGFI